VATRKVPKKAHILAILKILLAKLLILAEKKAKLPMLLFKDLGAEKNSRLTFYSIHPTKILGGGGEKYDFEYPHR
jgi:hypothetical protein